MVLVAAPRLWVSDEMMKDEMMKDEMMKDKMMKDEWHDHVAPAIEPRCSRIKPAALLPLNRAAGTLNCSHMLHWTGSPAASMHLCYR